MANPIRAWLNRIRDIPNQPPSIYWIGEDSGLTYFMDKDGLKAIMPDGSIRNESTSAQIASNEEIEASMIMAPGKNHQDKHDTYFIPGKG